MGKKLENSSNQKETYNSIIQEYLAPKSTWNVLRAFFNKSIIYDGYVGTRSGIPLDMSNIAVSRYGGFGTSGEMYLYPKTPGLDPRNLYVQYLMTYPGCASFAHDKFKESLGKDVHNFIKTREQATTYLPIFSHEEPANPLIHTILNDYPHLHPEWRQRISDTLGKYNLADLSEKIHNRDEQTYQEISNLLGYLGYHEDEKQSLIQKLKDILPLSAILQTSKEKKSDTQYLEELCQKSMEIINKSDINSVAIKNDSAAGFGVAIFEKKEIKSILDSSNPLETYMNYLASKLASKSPNFSDPNIISKHCQDIFMAWDKIAIQEGLEINKELSVQVIEAEPLLLTENLVDPSNQQHYGNIIHFAQQPDKEMVKIIKILNIFMYLKYESIDFTKQGVLDAIENIKDLGYFGLDLILTNQGRIQVIECNARTTGNTPAIMRVMTDFFENKILPSSKILTQSVGLPQFEISDLDLLAVELRKWLEMYIPNRLILDTINIYAMESLEVEAGKTPIVQINIKSLPNEDDKDFQERCQKIINLMKRIDPRHITNYNKNHQSPGL